MHLASLEKGTHGNRHLQSAAKLYGVEVCEWDILEECDIDKLDEREQYWIDSYEAEYLYNICLVVKSPGVRVMTEEERQNRSNSQKGRKFSDEHKKKLSDAAKKRGFSEKHSEAMRKASTGKKRKPFTEETKQKMAEARKAYWAKKREETASAVSLDQSTHPE